MGNFLVAMKFTVTRKPIVARELAPAGLRSSPQKAEHDQHDTTRWPGVKAKIFLPPNFLTARPSTMRKVGLSLAYAQNALYGQRRWGVIR